MLTRNPFPAPASLSGDQVICGTCSEMAAVRLVSGNLNLTVNVIDVPTVGPPLSFNLYYNAQDDVFTPELGHKWCHDYMARVQFDDWPEPSYANVVGPDGSRFRFNYEDADPEDEVAGAWVRQVGYRYTAAEPVDDTGTPGEWALDFPEGRRLVF